MSLKSPDLLFLPGPLYYRNFEAAYLRAYWRIWEIPCSLLCAPYFHIQHISSFDENALELLDPSLASLRAADDDPRGDKAVDDICQEIGQECLYSASHV